MPSDWDVHVSVGIGYGPLLMVGEHDAFGSEMNLASKFGRGHGQSRTGLAHRSRLGAHGREEALPSCRASARMSGLSFRYYEHKQASACPLPNPAPAVSVSRGQVCSRAETARFDRAQEYLGFQIGLLGSLPADRSRPRSAAREVLHLSGVYDGRPDRHRERKASRTVDEPQAPV